MIYKEFANIWDILMGDFDYIGCVDYIERIFKRFKVQPKEILELGCGTGNITIELLRRGYNVTGVDISPDMLSLANQKISGYKSNAVLLNQDIRDLKLEKKFDCVVSFMDVFNYVITNDDISKVFGNINRLLYDKGIFIFDIRSPHIFEDLMNDNVIAGNKQSVSYICDNFYDTRTRIAHMNVSFFKNIDCDEQLYKRYSEVHKLRCYYIEDIVNMLYHAHFNVYGIYDGLTFRKPSHNSERYFFVTGKHK